MLEYLYLICLLCLTISVPILIRGCFNIHKTLPQESGHLSNKLSDITDLLDEMADLATSFQRESEGMTSITQTPSHPLMALLSTLMTPKQMPSEYATKEPQGEIYEIDPQTQQETEIIADEHSTINNDSISND